jgi:hypothetical protein
MTFDRVFILYPRGSASGGPEALHQLADCLFRNGVTSFLVPLPGTAGIEPVDAFKNYLVEEADVVEDTEGSAVVLPETQMRLAHTFTSAKVFCWWLSIDNSDLWRSSFIARNTPATSLRDLAKKSWYAAKTPHERISRRSFNAPAYKHLTQSAYARNYLSATLGVDAQMLSDYTIGDSTKISPRGDAAAGFTVSFNPKKGAEWVAVLQRELQSLNINWLPIANLDRDGVRAALNRSDVYLDMGHHPGKDRLPREAALCGNVIVVARRGAGAFHEDVPIADEFKIQMSEPVVNASLVLKNVRGHLTEAFAAQAEYRRSIERERAVFEAQVVSIFGPSGA